jgi:hypothetical protein
MYLRAYQTDCEPIFNVPDDKERRRKKISKKIKPGGKFWIKTNTTQTYYKVTYSVVRDTTAYIVW